MQPACVVILSGHSLFAEGVASRLQQHVHKLELVIIDPRVAGAFEQIVAAKPSAIILDATDAELSNLCPLSRILTAIPSVKIVRLDPRREQIQVVTSEQKLAGKVSDLIEMITPSD